MTYRVEIVGAAKRQFKKLSKENQRRVLGEIEKPADNPRPRGCKQLQGEENLFCPRVGDYRVIYEIRDRVLLVLVLTVAHRREVYL
ncbi:MAG: type II toxin-antitoxin system RelE/ParE family toxin [Pyrinomonadaceae bacterium]|nr:type II toxin-antitoxin system RelE/ParE family toxin [Pyrinomonadaceae bacterium]